jgi:hypothetical protein
LRGTASCAAAACHGDSGPRGSRGSEYAHWVASDKHAQAYNVLLTDQSRIIQRNYHGLARLTDAHPETDLTCLRCHATDAEQARRGNLAARADGVGCERCHGPAGNWLTEHYTRGWREKSDAEKRALGFLPTKDLVSRAETCAECHVGVPGQEVDHDLLAAGHPRLNFEYASYLVALPPHWSRREEKARVPDLEERSWVVGQALSARKALTLLEHRARDDKRAWPEFAEYDCYACHHSLQEPSRHVPRLEPGRKIGSLPFASWYYAQLGPALDGRVPAGDHDRLASALETLGKRMNEPLPRRTDVAEAAKAARRELGRCLASLEDAPPGWAARTLTRLVEDRSDRFDATWDDATQCYLALLALQRATRDQGGADPRMDGAFRQLGAQLLYQPPADSPDRFDPARFHQQRRDLREFFHD